MLVKRRLITLIASLAGYCCVTTDICNASCNSVVRFQIRYGTTVFGDIDVELFDFDKPITVSNFLSHVTSGAYDRSFLHRLAPSFVLQGGRFTVENPNVSAPFAAMSRIPEGRPITNEFNRGPRISNTFGTLAMALSFTNHFPGTNVSPLPDTATTSWFFNLIDNKDRLDPIYTVFGKVITGSEHLNFFNTLVEDSGIINMLGWSFLFSACDYPSLGGEGFVALESLPVAYYFFDCPWYSDLFNVQITVTRSARDAQDVCLNGPEHVAGQLRWSFATREGNNYDVEYTGDLNRTDWTRLRTIVGDDSVRSFTVSPTNESTFYRVLRR
jgi:cyclophilin family peptidyl-prolyl cis-trans isomerase